MQAPICTTNQKHSNTSVGRIQIMDYAQKDADIIFWPDQLTPRFKLVYPLEMHGNTSGSFQGKYSSLLHRKVNLCAS